MELREIFTASTLDEDTVGFLLEATANPDIARKLNDPAFRETVNLTIRNMTHDRHMGTVSRQLLSRIDGVAALEDAISNTQGDFARAADTLKDISRQEMSFGVLLESLVTHPDLVDKLAENPTMSASLTALPALLSNSNTSISHDDFIASIRAYIGISCVLAVYAWADSLPDESCRERALGVLRLWQGVDGYREVSVFLII